MAYSIKPLACDPTRIKGMSEKLLVVTKTITVVPSIASMPSRRSSPNSISRKHPVS